MWFNWPLMLYRNWLAVVQPQLSLMQPWGLSLHESDQALIFRAQIPGFRDNEMQASLHENQLEIKAERHEQVQGDEFHLSFHRKFTLPAVFKLEEAKTTFHDGVLEMQIPKPEAAEIADEPSRAVA